MDPTVLKLLMTVLAFGAVFGAQYTQLPAAQQFLLAGAGTVFGWAWLPTPTKKAAKKSPNVPPLPILCTLAVLAVSSFGCAGRFNEAQIAGIRERSAAKASGATPPTVDCDSLDDQHIGWDVAAKIAAAGAAATGVSTWPVQGDNAKIALGISAGVLGLIAVGAEAAEAGISNKWARYCSDQGGAQ